MITQEVKDFISGVEGVLEANSFETMCLYRMEKDRGNTWEGFGSGFGIDLGQTFISINKVTVRGKTILIVDATSRVVDWAEVAKWTSDNLPHNIPYTDAMNFHNLF